MTFRINYQDFSRNGTPVYINSENSFSYEPWNECDFSIIIGRGYNSLDVSLSTKNIVHVSGLNPKYTWEKAIVNPPKYEFGNLIVEGVELECAGTGVTYTENWKTSYDENSGWVQIGNNDENNIMCVCFARDTIGAINENGELVSIWIRPEFK